MLGVGSGILVGCAVAALVKRHNEKKTANIAGLVAGSLTSVTAVVLILLSEEKKREATQLSVANLPGLTKNDMWYHIGQNTEKSTISNLIGEIRGYPETGTNSWRLSNDEIFIAACNKYNEKYGLSEKSESYISPKMLKAWAMVESGGSKDAFLTDPLQVNNPRDWDDMKANIAGLTQNQHMTPEASALAALEWRRYKGYRHDETGAEIEWRGDFQAFRRYNGNTNPPPAQAETDRTEHRDYYADLILELGAE